MSQELGNTRCSRKDGRKVVTRYSRTRSRPEKKCYLQCNNCTHQLDINRLISRSPFTTADQINQNIARFQCSKCGSKNIAVIEKSFKNRLATKPDSRTRPTIKSGPPRDRYIDEGIAGTREDHKKMRRRQQGRNLSHKF